MDFSHIVGFDWDEFNLDKNTIKHNVYPMEAEQVFFNEPIMVMLDSNHSQSEQRYYVLGRTDHERLLFCCFAIRTSLIRIISVRDMTRKEVRIYEEFQKRNASF